MAYNLKQNVDFINATSPFMAEINSDVVGSHALGLLDIIDAKTASIFTFIGVLIATNVIFITSRDDFSEAQFRFQNYLEGISLLSLIGAALFALSCIHIVDLRKMVLDDRSTKLTIERLVKIAIWRRRRYLIAFWLTGMGTIMTSFIVLNLALSNI